MAVEMVRLMQIASAGAVDAKIPVARMVVHRLDTAYGLMETRLGEAAFFAGAEFTAADIIMLFPLTTMRAFNGLPLVPSPI